MPFVLKVTSAFTAKDETEAEEFDKTFQPKEKLKLPGQLFS